MCEGASRHHDDHASGLISVKISICVIFRNSESHLPYLLKSFQYLPVHKFEFEFVFIDNASTDRSAERVKNYPGSTYYFRDTNHLAQARNDALHLSRSEWVYFIDSDCELNPTTFSELLVHVNPEDLTVAGWGGAQIFPQDNEFLLLLNQFRQTFLGHFGSVQMKPGQRVELVDHLSTSHVLYRKSALLQVAGFDPRLNESAEDLDLSLRLQKKGQKLIFVPDSKINHRVASNYKEWIRKAWRNGQWQTRLAFYNSEILKTRRFWPPLILGLLLYGLLTAGLFSTLFGLICLYALILMVELRSENLKLYGLFVITHGLYFIGGLWGLIRGFQDFIFSNQAPRPTKKEWVSQAGK